nr:cyclin-dependent protein kinase inhibitor SMR6 [Ipomoea batatas]
MGFSKKLQVDSGKESEGKKWVFAEIAICAPLTSISTKPKEENAYHSDEDRGSTTPTSRDSRIPERLPCPPAPRKRRPASSSCRYNGAREFFDPPDLESVFIRHVERAN